MKDTWNNNQYEFWVALGMMLLVVFTAACIFDPQHGLNYKANTYMVGILGTLWTFAGVVWASFSTHLGKNFRKMADNDTFDSKEFARILIAASKHTKVGVIFTAVGIVFLLWSIHLSSLLTCLPCPT